MFQKSSIIGGYDADERAFCFSYYDENKAEYWFQFELATAVRIANGLDVDIEVDQQNERLITNSSYGPLTRAAEPKLC